jgi:threonylcarbamoyladenosine tRNA methylthiotransferase MtaB
MKYSVITFGCRVNQADSLGFEEELRALGGLPSSAHDADLVIVNTCSVTASADQGARQTIRRVSRTNPQARIVVTGCYATRRPDDVGALPNVVHVVPNAAKPELLSIVRRAAVGTSSAVSGDDLPPLGLPTGERFSEGDASCGAAIEPGIAGRTSFTLRVQTGCGERCSYCVIPATRGPARSVGVRGVLREVDRIAAAGFKEIVLTGVHLGSYGRDLCPQSSLAELLTALGRGRASVFDPEAQRSGAGECGKDPAGARRENAVLFRISSLEPMDCTRAIVDLVAAGDRFAPHFHLPLQHGSNRLLAAMRRPYTVEHYGALVDDIRGRIPHASIGSDVIVGFPGETQHDFDELASCLERSPLTHLHVFPYSDRPGTEAASMAGKVGGAVVRERAQRLRTIGARLAARFREAQVGTIRPALTIEDGSMAVTDNYLKVRIPPGRARNEWVRVRIRGSASAALEADVIA